MSEFAAVMTAVWGVSGVAVVVLFTLDERSHRRSRAAQRPADVPVRPAAAAARPKLPAHVDRALV